MDGRLDVYQWLQFLALHADATWHRRRRIGRHGGRQRDRIGTESQAQRCGAANLHAREGGPGDHARWLCMWQALWGSFYGDQHEPENNKPLGSEANEVLATGIFGR
jgi:hypothetical protein